MILVTVGTHWFDELIEVVDGAVGEGRLREDVLLQIGNGGDFVPEHCPYFRIAPSLQPFLDRADLVVGHGGSGTTIEALVRGKTLISVANTAMKDDHQSELLGSLAEEGIVVFCRQLDELIPLMEVSLRQGEASQQTFRRIPRLTERLTGEVTHLPPRRRTTWVSRMANKVMHRWAIDVEQVYASESSSLGVEIIDPRPVSQQVAFWSDWETAR